MKFISFQSWLKKSFNKFLFEQSEEFKYGCLMLYADIPNWKDKISFVHEDDIYEKGKGKKYSKKLEKPFKVRFNKVVYSSTDENKKYFYL